MQECCYFCPAAGLPQLLILRAHCFGVSRFSITNMSVTLLSNSFHHWLDTLPPLFTLVKTFHVHIATTPLALRLCTEEHYFFAKSVLATWSLTLIFSFKILVWYNFLIYHSHAASLLYLCQYVAKRWGDLKNYFWRCCTNCYRTGRG